VTEPGFSAERVAEPQQRATDTMATLRDRITAAAFTFGASEAAIPVETEVTSQIVDQIIKQAVSQVEQRLVRAVEGPILSALGSAAGEMAGQLLGDALGTHSGLNLNAVGSPASSGFQQHTGLGTATRQHGRHQRQQHPEQPGVTRSNGGWVLGPAGRSTEFGWHTGKSGQPDRHERPEDEIRG